MLFAATVIQLALWVGGSHAFFPWIPCEDGASCAEQTRRRDSGSEGILTFPLSVRASKEKHSESETQRISRIAHFLAEKYVQVVPPSSGNKDGRLDRRQNNKYSISKAENPSFPSSAPLHQDGTDFSYFVEVGMGSGSKQMLMLLDTGAGTTWIMGSTCKSTPCTIHNTFGPEDSSSFQTQDKEFSIHYGTGSVSGSLAKDSISLAGKTVSMTIGIANFTSEHFNHFPFDGILGLSTAAGATDNFLQTLKKESVFMSNVMGVFINRNSDGPNKGEVSFGGIDSEKYNGSITYTNVPSNAGGVWSIPLDDFAYDGKKAGISGRQAYIDTGTTYIFGPPDDVAALHKQIPGAKSSDGVTYTAPCGSAKPLTVSFSGTSYTIFTSDWLQKANSNGDCVSNLYGNEVVKNSWLLGSAYLKNVYAVFDMDQSRIGFAPRTVPPQVTTTSATTTGSAATGITGPSSPEASGSTTASASPAIQTSTQPASPADHKCVGRYILSLSIIFASVIPVLF